MRAAVGMSGWALWRPEGGSRTRWRAGLALVNALALVLLALALPADAAQSATRHKPVTHLRAAKVARHHVVVRWHNPAGKRFRGVLIVRKAGREAPATPHDGVRVGKVAAPDHSARVPHLHAGHRYSVSVFARYRHRHHSRPASLTVTTKPASDGTTPVAGPTPTPTPAPTPISKGASLSHGQSLAAGERLTSPNGQYAATMQADGDFVVSQGGTVLWSTQTATPGSTLTLQDGGNLVVQSPGGTIAWSSSTAPSSLDRLDMQDDGALVVYSRGGVPLWSSKGGRTGFSENSMKAGSRLTTNQALWSHNGTYKAIMQGDGNFVVYASGGSALWSTRTSTAGSNVVMQTDGNLVVYDPAGKALWSSQTATSSDDRLDMQDDGNLVIYSGAGSALWSSKGGKVGGGTSSSFLQLPFGVGQSWSANGPHQYGASGPRNSVDLTGGDGHVRAAADGTVRFIPCSGGGHMLMIDHADGWHTSYYHVTNERVSNGQAVHAGDVLADVGQTLPCGGDADGNQVHFSLWRYTGTFSWSAQATEAYPLDGVQIGGWTVYQGSDNYLGKWVRRSDGFTYTVPSSGDMSCGCIRNDGTSASSPPPPTSTSTGTVLADPCLNFRSGVGGSAPQIGCIPKGTVIPIQCTAQGNAVSGPYGTTTIWDRTSYGGQTGYVSDAWVYTGTNSAAAPPC